MNEEWKPDYSVTPRRIVCAAVRKGEHLIIGVRHYDKIMRKQMRAIEGTTWWVDCEQGFVDQFGYFLNREEAWKVAVEQGQIHREVSRPGILYSENLY